MRDKRIDRINHAYKIASDIGHMFGRHCSTDLDCFYSSSAMTDIGRKIVNYVNEKMQPPIIYKKSGKIVKIKRPTGGYNVYKRI